MKRMFRDIIFDNGVAWNYDTEGFTGKEVRWQNNGNHLI